MGGGLRGSLGELLLVSGCSMASTLWRSADTCEVIADSWAITAIDNRTMATTIEEGVG